MGAYTDLLTLLNTHLEMLPNSPSIDWENDADFKYTEGTVWLKAMNIPTNVEGASLGSSAPNEWRGIFQVDVNHPSGIGVLDPADVVDRIVSHFKRGTILSNSNVRLTVTRCQPEPAMMDRGWYIVPISIYYYAHAQNT